ncbi:DNA polymerase III subunit alpha [Arcanobacterium bovis]|uniref:Error-prone DNA polymerase n=2 Tax=Arcanobacterium bovis TaxID=2529275 RepID=A0A4V2KR96_9ACTO|nr:DNA polymerase III subunit alpha [Arcanobacterium bovis]
MRPYSELHVHSAYSFLDGASMPAELVQRAVELELEGIALTDHDGLPGVVQLSTAARAAGLPTIIGSEISIADSTGELKTRAGQRDPQAKHVIVLARDTDGYRRLSRTLSEGMLKSGEKGKSSINLEMLSDSGKGYWQILTGCRKGYVRSALEEERGMWAFDKAYSELDRLIQLFGKDSVAVEITNWGQPLERERNDVLVNLAKKAGVRVVATNNVHSARFKDVPLSDVLAAIRAGETVEDLAFSLPSWGSYLRSGNEMEIIHYDHLEAVDTAAEIGRECAFDLTLVAPQLPPFPVPAQHTEATWLRELVEKQGTKRYGSRQENTVAWRQIDHELEIILALGFAGYFLIVHEIVEFCRTRGIWCQGRGSAANSAVCFALGITAVDAVKHKMLFERFISPGRSGPPDIDLDIEARLREEVIQHVYERYGRKHAAQVANVITYRRRSAIRDVARVFGYNDGISDAWAKDFERKSSVRADERGVLEPKSSSHMPSHVEYFVSKIQNLPRHLGIHSGGMVICDRPVVEVCPVGWANKRNRTVLQWDKDDCAEAGLVKFDLLGLGMLTALKIAFTSLKDFGIRADDGSDLHLYNVNQEDSRVFDLLCAADTVGVFQVESRAQMATLPRLQPRTFYDIVIEVALIRPGPIQGDSVNPYLNRRRGREAITYLHPLLEKSLKKTLGVPLFQEQLMQMAIDVAGFSPAQADRLRKAMGSKRSHEKMEELHAEMVAGMKKRGVDDETCEIIFRKLHAFADFGFPESHSFSFAYLVYASAWLKVYYPEFFYAGILAAQPMGFYSPQTLLTDARQHGILILPVDVCHSGEHTQVEKTQVQHKHTVKKHPLVNAHPDLGIRLGLSNIKGCKRAIERILAARSVKQFESVADLAHRAELNTEELKSLSASGALESLKMKRREGTWVAQALSYTGIKQGNYFQPAILGTEVGVSVPNLPEMTEAEEVYADLQSMAISPHKHVMDILRPRIDNDDVRTVAEVRNTEAGTRVWVAGVVTHRQRPRTAGGITFISLEDETGLLNIVCSEALWNRYSTLVRYHQGLLVRGKVERGDDVVNLIADGFKEVELGVKVSSRDFR